MSPQGFLSNHAGGVLGGISTGQPLVISVALKPTSSIPTPGKTVNMEGEPEDVITTGRHDPCVGIRAVPIAEAMLALVLADHLMRNRALGVGDTPGPLIPGQLTKASASRMLASGYSNYTFSSEQELNGD